jgi:hypothetical protein
MTIHSLTITHGSVRSKYTLTLLKASHRVTLGASHHAKGKPRMFKLRIHHCCYSKARDYYPYPRRPGSRPNYESTTKLV